MKNSLSLLSVNFLNSAIALDKKHLIASLKILNKYPSLRSERDFNAVVLSERDKLVRHLSLLRS